MLSYSEEDITSAEEIVHNLTGYIPHLFQLALTLEVTQTFHITTQPYSIYSFNQSDHHVL